jgi:antitoxin (DNA-binding transcriptional repressor) of toxin-antitoxin stability system
MQAGTEANTPSRYDNLIIMESHVTATEAARTFSDLLNRVLYRREVFVVERGGQPVCRIVPAGAAGFKLRDLVQLWKTIPKPDPGYWDTIEEINRTQPPLPESPWER